jgi:hypothetical protein
MRCMASRQRSSLASWVILSPEIRKLAGIPVVQPSSPIDPAGRLAWEIGVFDCCTAADHRTACGDWFNSP